MPPSLLAGLLAVIPVDNVSDTEHGYRRNRREALQVGKRLRACTAGVALQRQL